MTLDQRHHHEQMSSYIMNRNLYLGQKSSNSYHSMYGNQRALPLSGWVLHFTPHIKPLINDSEVFHLFSFTKRICLPNSKWRRQPLYPIAAHVMKASVFSPFILPAC